MDAISFVLGVQSKQLRSDKMKDLVYDADSRRDKSNRTAKVSLFYQPSDSVSFSFFFISLGIRWKYRCPNLVQVS